MNPIPTISKNSPLKLEEADEVYTEGKAVKKWRLVFIAGSAFSVAILVSTWLIFAFWIQKGFRN